MKREGKRKKSYLWQILTIATALLCIAVIATLNALLPFRTLLPAYDLEKAHEGQMRVYFLDVGQGDCTVVAFPDGSALVVDAGDGSWENQNKLERFLKGLNATSLSFLITHADVDHCGGIAPLLESFGAEHLYLPAISSKNAMYMNILTVAERRGIPTSIAKRYDVITAAGAYGVFLSPYAAGETDENNSSAVLFLSYAGVNTVLTGDITSAREGVLRREYGLSETLFDVGEYTVRLDDVDILKVAHHGSANASSEEWLSLLRPEVAVISCGRGNLYGHPTGETLARLTACGSEIYRTDELKDIVAVISPDGTYRMKYGFLK